MKTAISALLSLSCLLISNLSFGDQDQFQAKIDSLKICNLSENNPEIIVNNNNQIAFLYGTINIDSSLNHSEKAKTIAKEIQYKHGLAVAHSYSARASLEKGLFKKAIKNFNIASQLFIDENDTLNLLDTYRGLSYVYSYSASQLKSLEYNLKALEIAEQIQDSTSLSYIYNNIGTIYKKLDNYNSSLFYLQKSLEIDKKRNNIIDCAISLSNIGILKIENHKQEEASIDYKNLQKLLPKITNIYSKAYLYLSLSGYYNSLSIFDSTQYYIDIANQLCSKETFPQIQARAYLKQGETYLKQKKYKESIVFFNRCIELSNSLDIGENDSKIYRMMANAYSELGYYREAYKHSQLANDARDSLKKNITASHLFEFENEQRLINEIEREKLKQELQNQQIENASIKIKLRFQIAILTIVLLISIVAIIISFYIKSKKNNTTLKVQHDLINHQKKLLEENIKKLELSETDLRKLNTTKDKIFSIISHDLKSPFNSILGFTDLLIENFDQYSDQKRKEIIHIIEKSSKSTLFLLDNLLNWSRAQSGYIKIDKKEYLIKTIVSNAISPYLGNAYIKEIHIHNAIEEDLKIWGDKETLQIVISNLFNNAIKFSKEKGEITITSQIKKTMLELCISDSGIGMNEEIMKDLFVLEKVVQRKGTSNEKGTGLGLMLCQQFIHQNGGKIWVKSKTEKGSQFYFTIPLVEI